MTLDETVVVSVLASLDPKRRRELVFTFLSAEISAELWPGERDEKAAEEHMTATLESVESFFNQHIRTARMVGV